MYSQSRVFDLVWIKNCCISETILKQTLKRFFIAVLIVIKSSNAEWLTQTQINHHNNAEFIVNSRKWIEYLHQQNSFATDRLPISIILSAYGAGIPHCPEPFGEQVSSTS